MLGIKSSLFLTYVFLVFVLGAKILDFLAISYMDNDIICNFRFRISFLQFSLKNMTSIEL